MIKANLVDRVCETLLDILIYLFYSVLESIIHALAFTLVLLVHGKFYLEVRLSKQLKIAVANLGFMANCQLQSF